MKKHLIYAITLLLVLFSSACSKDQTEQGGTGTLALNISTSRTDAGLYDPMDHLLVRIYNSQGGLLRKYKSKEAVPARLELLAGDYTITVEAGEIETASHEKCFYKGESAFTVIAGQTINAQVVCKIVNTIVEAKFDASIAANFGTNAKVWIAAGEADTTDEIDTQILPVLTFTEDGRGYFTMPEGVTTLSWIFEGTHNSRGEVVQHGTMTGIKANSKYKFTFRYSPDLPGYIECFTIRVDDSTDDRDDTIIFSPDPSIAGIGFDMKQPYGYIAGTTGDVQYAVTTMGTTSGLTVTVGGQTYDAFAGVPEASVVRDDDYNLTLTLSNDLFAGRPGGVYPVTFHITDVDGGSLTTTAQFRLQGAYAMQASDYDLWSNSIAMRAIVVDPTITSIKFGLRTAGGEWQEVEGTNDGQGNYSATISPEWLESKNAADLTVYTPKAGTGVWANGNYEIRTTFDGTTIGSDTFSTAGGQTIPDSDMESSSLGCYGTSSGPFWGSGNNSFASGLCSRGTYAGSQGSYCAYLKSSSTLGMLASGNLFSGDFSMSGTNGTVKFGRKYNWESRPRALSVLYYASIGNVNIGSSKIPSGQPDKARIYVVIIDWSKTHNVTSGTGTPAGSWDPAAATSTDEGAIIACGSVYIQSTEGAAMLPIEIPIEYYDTVTKPDGNYTLIISCACSAYGDYMNGCSSNKLWVDDFKWVY